MLQVAVQVALLLYVSVFLQIDLVLLRVWFLTDVPYKPIIPIFSSLTIILTVSYSGMRDWKYDTKYVTHSTVLYLLYFPSSGS